VWADMRQLNDIRRRWLRGAVDEAEAANRAPARQVRPARISLRDETACAADRSCEQQVTVKDIRDDCSSKAGFQQAFDQACRHVRYAWLIVAVSSRYMIYMCYRSG